MQLLPLEAELLIVKILVLNIEPTRSPNNAGLDIDTLCIIEFDIVILEIQLWPTNPPAPKPQHDILLLKTLVFCNYTEQLADTAIIPPPQFLEEKLLDYTIIFFTKHYYAQLSAITGEKVSLVIPTYAQNYVTASTIYEYTHFGV
ncbi:Hypothetical_protein [Hexamita inflata]|uniref:Hypothetical_protein n=1 Tax=Hexamita inflata TaxID=28002 RepID=A0AA86RBY9_9EUKA|nr:Hypothetical protein HINF_LOCUS29061 [Hexamita inflata]CAI9974640.1 Hypothetical protein HINF_LOCUS62285 [Hexamita inflata]